MPNDPWILGFVGVCVVVLLVVAAFRVVNWFNAKAEARISGRNKPSA